MGFRILRSLKEYRGYILLLIKLWLSSTFSLYVQSIVSKDSNFFLFSQESLVKNRPDRRSFKCCLFGFFSVLLAPGFFLCAELAIFVPTISNVFSSSASFVGVIFAFPLSHPSNLEYSSTTGRMSRKIEMKCWNGLTYI